MLLLDRSAGTSELTWPIFASVITINSLSDALGCTGCLRSALGAVGALPKPALIQFAPGLTGSVTRSPGLPALAASDVTLDAIAPDGVPWERTIDGSGLDESALVITGARNFIVGLRLSNVGGNADVVLITGENANGNVLSQVQVVGRALVTCGSGLDGCLVDGSCRIPGGTQPQGVCGDDGIAVRSGGSVEPNRIEHCDVSGAYDKGIKVSDGGVAMVTDSVIHDNRDGGIQATLSGNVTALRNVIENNRGDDSANGLAANGPSAATQSLPARLTTRGNLTRNNSLRGISVRSFSVVSLQDDYACGNGTLGRGTGLGLAVLGDADLFPTLTVRGVASVYNLDSGVNVAGTAVVDFGVVADPGYNVFTGNGAASIVANFQNASPAPIDALVNQWEHCGRRPVCDDAAIAAADVGGPVTFSPALSSRWNHDTFIEAVDPSSGAAGDLVRVYGRGFDAIEGQPRDGSCATIALNNRCLPNRGNCVRVGQVDAEVIAITPTMLIVKLPTTCVSPTTLSVRARHGQKRLQTRFCFEPNEAE